MRRNGQIEGGTTRVDHAGVELWTTEPRRRERFFDSYVSDLVSRDVSQLSAIERTSEMRALISLLSARSAQLLIPATLGNEIRLPRRTAERYIGLLEEVF
jgi:predicted AAA+ superfamily ATPase